MNKTISELEQLTEKMEIDASYSFKTDFVANYVRLCDHLLRSGDIENCQYYLCKLTEIKAIQRGIIKCDGTVGWYDEKHEEAGK